METVETTETKYDIAKNESVKHINAILNSRSIKKVVVAGAGTGKTYLFKEILKHKNNTLTLTFVNSLVEDLSLELCGLSEVKTLHGFARSILAQITRKTIKVFPKFVDIIKEDGRILIEQDIDFNKIFNERDDTNKFLEFYSKRREYYNYYGFSDIIFAGVNCLENSKENIPVFEQILVDEFQDFNKLEVSLIDLLAEKSPVLIAGDDDQALYEFKSASTVHIREKHSEENTDYASFNLPFCRRCTRVVVEATNDIIENAKQYSFLKGRIDKPFIYFDDEKKDKDSDKYSKIIYTHQFGNKIPWFIEKKIGEMAEEIQKQFSVLIISPYTKQSLSIVESLKEKGLKNVQYADKDGREITFLDGLKILLVDKQDNLGWRIVSKFLMNEESFFSLVRNTEKNPDKKIYELIDKNLIKEVKNILRVLKYVNNDKTVNENDFFEVFKKIGFNSFEVSKEFLKKEINFTNQRRGNNSSIKKIPIKASTIQSSKGLAGDLVFITHFDDLYFIKDKDKTKITDQDICNFLVALTRTRKKIYLISTRKEVPTFLKWISKEQIEFIKG